MAGVVPPYHPRAAGLCGFGGGAQCHRKKGGIMGYSVPEIRRLLHLVGLEDTARLALHLHWSLWRRQHQWQAGQATSPTAHTPAGHGLLAACGARSARSPRHCRAATVDTRALGPDRCAVAARADRRASVPPASPDPGRDAVGHDHGNVLAPAASARSAPGRPSIIAFNAGNARASGSRFAPFCSLLTTCLWNNQPWSIGSRGDPRGRVAD